MQKTPKVDDLAYISRLAPEEMGIYALKDIKPKAAPKTPVSQIALLGEIIGKDKH